MHADTKDMGYSGTFSKGKYNKNKYEFVCIITCTCQIIWNIIFLLHFNNLFKLK